MLADRKNRRGFTLLELVIAVAIMTILTAVGIWMSNDLLPRWRTRAAAWEFATHVQECRLLAVRSGRECRVLLVEYDTDLDNLSADNAGIYQIAVGDKDKDSTTWDLLPPDAYEDSSDDDQSQGTIDLGPDSEEHKRFVAIDDWGNIGGSGEGNVSSIVFSPRGFVTNPTTDFTGEGNIDITFVNKFERARGRTEDFIVKITRSGMVRVDSSVELDYDDLYSGTPTSSTMPSSGGSD